MGFEEHQVFILTIL